MGMRFTSISARRSPEASDQIMITHKLLELITKRESNLKSIIDKTKIIEVDDSTFSCAAIYIDSKDLTLAINKLKFNRLTTEEKMSVVAHEFGHVTLGHLSTRFFPDEDRFLVGLAQDVALNDGLSPAYRLPVWFVTPKKLGVPKGLSTQQYLSLFKSMKRDDLTKIVHIPSYQIKSDQVQNQKTIKKIIDETRVSY